MSKNEKVLVKILLLLLILISIPIIWIAFYSHPSVDDYAFGLVVKEAIQQYGINLWKIIKVSIRYSYNKYFTWAGSYGDSFTGALMPGNFGCYWISAIIIYSLLISSIFYLFKNICVGLVGRSYKWIGSICAVFASVIITQNWPSSAEALYWFDGAQSYMGYHAVYLWLCGIIIHYFLCDDKKRSNVDIGLSIIMAIIVAGGNNLSSFISVLTCVFFVAIAIIVRRKWGIIFTTVVSIAFFLVSYLAPGTTARGGDFASTSSILGTIVKCFRWTLRQYLLDWTTTGIVLVLLFMTPWLIKLTREIYNVKKIGFKYPLFIFVMFVCFISSMSSPAFYVLGESGPLRLRNLIYVNYVITLFFTYAYFCGWLSVNKLNEKQVSDISQIYCKIPLKYTICILGVVCILICAGDAKKYGTSIEATKEILNGTAKQYHEENLARYEIYMNPEIEHVIVEPLSVRPEIIYFDDITDDVDNWKNTCTAQYFGKKTIKLSRYEDYIDYE